MIHHRRELGRGNEVNNSRLMRFKDRRHHRRFVFKHMQITNSLFLNSPRIMSSHGKDFEKKHI
jgi:hypothetical protein